MSILAFFGAAGILFVGPYIGLLGIFALVTLFGRRPQIAQSGKNSNFKLPTFVFLVPAHNEEATIHTTVKSLQKVRYPKESYKIVVLADNCNDKTAEISRSFGVYVTERSHPTRRSKGYALEEVLPQLLAAEEFKNTDAIVVVDADTKVEVDVLEALARPIQEGCDWLQGLDIVENVNDTWRTKLLAYGFALFNGTFQSGSYGVGAGAHLRGNGMCLSRKGLLRHPWKSGGLAEDLEFSWRLRIAGETVHFEPKAVFLAEMTSNPKASSTQRLRWEKGRHALWRELRQEVLNAKIPIFRRLVWVLDLTMPSLTALALGFVLVLALLVAGTYFVGSVPYILWLAAGLLFGCFLAYGLSPFLAFGLPWSVMSAVVALPYYALWRLVVALKRAPTAWVRTARRSDIERG